MTEINKAIEEMADEIFNAGVGLDGVDFAYKSDHFDRLAIKLYNAGYRKQSEEEINKIIITAKRKLYDANLESVNLIMGEREKDIKQAWQNGYNKAREEVVKEFADKLNEKIQLKQDSKEDFVRPNTIKALEFWANEWRNKCIDISKFIKEIAAEYGKEEV